MKSCCVLLLVLLGLARSATAQTLTSVDSIMAVRGIVELRTDRSDSGRVWVLFLPTPVAVKNLKTNTVTLADGERVAGRFVDRYVEVQGRVAVEQDAAAAPAPSPTRRASGKSPPMGWLRRTSI